MKARYFNTIMPRLNELWAGKSLGMEVNKSGGSDLINIENGIVVECKFVLTGKSCGAERYSLAYIVLEHQLEYQNGFGAYWGFGTYSLKKPVKKVKKTEVEKLEEMVLSRELWIVPWDFIERYPPSHTSGRTEISQWDSVLRYPKLKDVPEILETHEVKKGVVHLTEGVNPTHFAIL